jgi:hypothetical protein
MVFEAGYWKNFFQNNNQFEQAKTELIFSSTWKQSVVKAISACTERYFSL